MITKQNRITAIIALTLLIPAIAPAITNVVGDDAFTYGANFGWINWNGDIDNGARFNEQFLSGYIYGANVGWINLGDGSPDNGASYGNDSATDFGVNVDAASDPDFYILSGFAYSANLGWINFDVADVAGEENQPRIDKDTGVATGFAWVPNLGWIALESPGFAQLQLSLTAQKASAAEIQNHLLGIVPFTPQEVNAGDRNNDGDVNVADLIFALNND